MHNNETKKPSASARDDGVVVISADGGEVKMTFDSWAEIKHSVDCMINEIKKERKKALGISL